MRKFILAIFTILSITLLTVGCSNQTDTESNTKVTESTTSTSSTVTDIKYADMIPDPEAIFTDGKISVIDKDGGKAYIFQVTNYKDEEYESYVSECKKLGFTDVSYESENDGGKMFGAYTTDGEYWVEVLSGNDTGILAVTCKESTKK